MYILLHFFKYQLKDVQHIVFHFYYSLEWNIFITVTRLHLFRHQSLLYGWILSFREADIQYCYGAVRSLHACKCREKVFLQCESFGGFFQLVFILVFIYDRIPMGLMIPLVSTLLCFFVIYLFFSYNQHFYFTQKKGNPMKNLTLHYGYRKCSCCNYGWSIDWHWELLHILWNCWAVKLYALY